MEYRTNKRTGDDFSIIGIGTAYVGEKPEEEALAILKEAKRLGSMLWILRQVMAKRWNMPARPSETARRT